MGRTLFARHVGFVALLAVLLSMTGRTAACEGLTDGPMGTVREVLDGDSVILDNGLVARLIGIQAPKLAQGGAGSEDWPKAGSARAALMALVLERKVQFRYGGEHQDRHGRMLAQMFVVGAPEIWVQQALVEQGMARVYSFPDNRACLPDLLAAESRARTMKLGIWADPYYTVRQADRPAALLPLKGHFELVEGRVLKAENSGGRVFLNFGRLWKEDLTVVIDSKALRLFGAAGFDPLHLAGALVRVRGWLDDLDGPRIAVTHPEQIEVLASR